MVSLTMHKRVRDPNINNTITKATRLLSIKYLWISTLLHIFMEVLDVIHARIID